MPLPVFLPDSSSLAWRAETALDLDQTDTPGSVSRQSRTLAGSPIAATPLVFEKYPLGIGRNMQTSPRVLLSTVPRLTVFAESRGT